MVQKGFEPASSMDENWTERSDKPINSPRANASKSFQVMIVGEAQTSGQEDSLAKTLVSQASEPDLQASEVHSPSHSSTLWSDTDLGGSCWKMSLGSSVQTKALTSEGFSMKWSNSGMAYRGELWTLDTSESPSDGVECSLSQVLNPTAPARFSLSAKAASGILRRAGRRGKVLPLALQTALESLALCQQELTDSQTEYKSSSKDTSESLAKTEGSSVRRLTPTECERLMGWPDGWTISKAWRANRRSDTTK
jgi:site-specific DNA-cytosine methylase